MTTIHATLIDYRFRMLMSSVNHRKKVEKQQQSKSSGDFQVISVPAPKVEEIMEEEDQNFQLNGIIVEPKFENTEQEKARMRQKVLYNHPMLNPPYWVPNNITEFLFYDDQGVMQTNEETCKALFREFTTIMKTVYEETQKKYEDTIKVII